MNDSISEGSKDFAIILLAAGASSRMGLPKLLLPFKEGSLISSCVQIAEASRATKVIIVTGVYDHEIRGNLKLNGILKNKHRTRLFHNSNWGQGISSSIKAGLNFAKGYPAVVIMLADQPFITADHINRIAEEALCSEFGISASETSESLAPPCGFRAEHFEALQNLSGDSGAKNILKEHFEQVVSVQFEHAKYDIDLPSDYQNLKSPQS